MRFESSRLFSLAICLGLAGCSLPQPATKSAPAPVVKPVFAFTAPEPCKAAGTAKITFGIVSPQFVKNESEQVTMYSAKGRAKLQAMYAEMSAAMRSDFLSLTSCKGFLAKGPYQSFGDMVFPDRIGSDLILVPELDIRIGVDATSRNTTSNLALLINKNTPQVIMVDGSVTLSGRVTIAVKESVTELRMWTRSIEIPAETFPFRGEEQFGAQYGAMPNAVALEDPAFLRALGPHLEKLYGRILTTTWNYLDAREMAVVRQQSLEPRNKAISGIAR